MKHLYVTLSVLFFLLFNIANSQIVTSLAGSGSGLANGTGFAASFNLPWGLVADGSGNIYVADYSNNEIRKIVLATKAVTLFAGSPTGQHDTNNGAATAAGFYGPTGITTDGTNLYVADFYNNLIRKIVIATGVVSNLAGGSAFSAADGTGSAAGFNNPNGIVYDGIGNLYVADQSNNDIRKIVIATGAVTTFAGKGPSIQGSTNGIGTAASFAYPTQITTDGTNLYVCDENNYEVRQIVIATAAVTTLAGNLNSGSTDGIGSSARFSGTFGITYDGKGNLFVSDGVNDEIRKIVIATAAVSTYAGSAGESGLANGNDTAARFYYPYGLTTDVNGLMYLTDQGNNMLRMITPMPSPIAYFKANNTSICPGSTVQFTDTSHNYVTGWHWTFQNGTPSTSTAQNPTVVYNTTGTDSVTLVVSNYVGKDSLTKKLYITVNPSPAAPTAGSNSPICTGSSLNFTASNTGSTYNWTGPNAFTSSLQNPTIASALTVATGTYTVIATSSAGCNSAPSTVTVAVNVTPPAPTVDSVINICAGSTLNLVASAAVATSYNWVGPNSFSSNTQNPSLTGITTAAAGTYTVTAANACGTSAIATTFANIETTIPSVPTTTSNSPICAGGALNLIANSVGALTYSWTGANSFLSTLQNPSITSAVLATAGTYSVTATNACGTTATGNTTVKVNTLPVVSISGNLLVCNSGSDTLTANITGTGPYKYYWSTSGTNDTTILSASLLANQNTPIVTTIAGSVLGNLDGTGTAATFSAPSGIIADNNGNLFITDENNNNIRKLNIATGVVTTFVNSTAGMNDPYQITIDASGNLYLVEFNGSKVRKINGVTGVVTTIAGAGTQGYADGTGASALFNYPAGIATDNTGNLYVADSRNNRIRKIVIATGVVTTFAGHKASAYTNGIGTAAAFSNPIGLVMDGDSVLYVADNSDVRKIVIATAAVSTFAGTGKSGSADGKDTLASFGSLQGITKDDKGNLFVSDQLTNKIRKINIATGIVTTLAGSGATAYGDGIGISADFWYPKGITVDNTGLYVADPGNARIRKITLPSPSTVTVTDVNGCLSKDSITVTVNAPAIMSIRTSPTSVCAGTPDTLFASGATTYLWNNGSTTSSILQVVLTTTPYFVVGNGGECPDDTAKALLIVAGTGVSQYLIPQNPTCGGLCNGAITDFIYGGVPPFKFLWSNGDTTDTITNLCAGTYSLTLIQPKGCSGPDTIKTSVVLPAAQMGYDLEGYIEACIDTPSFNSASIEAAIFNNRCMPVNGTLKLVIDTAFHITSTLADTAAIVSGDTLIWNYKNLSDTGYGQGIILNGTVSNIPAGDSVFVSFYVTPTIGDSAPWNNSGTIWVKAFPYNCVGLPFDPNEKSVSPIGDIADTQKLTYTIHFQNTGTAIAHNVVVVDTLSANLDPTTLKVLSSSNAMTMQIISGHIVKFMFDNIDLPDTGTSKTTSIGVFTYTIKPIKNVKPGSQLVNKAGIYFDANRPVFTNKTVNIIANVTSVQNIEPPINIACFPNPFSISTSVVFNTNGIHYLELDDITGRKIETLQCTGRQYELQRGNLAPGVYFIKAYDEAMKYVAVSKLVVE